jgi:hypothetical protein
MKALVLVCAGLATAAAQAGDPVADCRAAHAADPSAHIACLERALGAPGPKAVAAASPSPGPRASASPKPSPIQELGALTPAERVSEVAVEIVSASYSNGLGTFELADGQIWRETDKTPAQLRLDPGTHYRARIERGTLGGYRMYVDGVRRMLKVKRVK